MPEWKGRWELYVKGNAFHGVIWTDDIEEEDGTITALEMTQTETGKHFKLPPAEIKNIAGGVLFKGEGRIIISDRIEP